MEILFVTTRNVATTSGELRLIRNRAEALKEHFGVDTKFISYIDEERAKSKNTDGVHNYFKTKYIKYNKKNPFTFFTKYNKFVKATIGEVEEIKPKIVIVSGIIKKSLTKKIKEIDKNIKIVVDVHGATEELLEFPSNGIIYSKLLHFYMDNTFKKSLKYIDGALVVSNELKKYMLEKYSSASKLDYFIVPCSNSVKYQTDEDYFENRNEWRKKLSIEAEELLFVYSGGASKWQMIDETIALYHDLKNKINKNSKLLVMSHMIDKIKQDNPNTNEDVIYKSFTQNEVPKVLAACDISFLLRDDNITNNVAFPNKFLEYVQAKTYIITTPYVKDIAKITEEYHLGSIVDLENTTGLPNDINFAVKEKKELRKYERVLKSISFEDTLIPFIEFIETESKVKGL